MKAVKAKIIGITKKGYSKAKDKDDNDIVVPYGCPGDTVIIDMTGVGKGKIIDIVENSKDRVPVICQHAGFGEHSKPKCGGCSFQYIDYDKQLELKSGLIKNAFSKKGIDAEILPVLKSDKIFHYRNRIDFSVSVEKKLGLRSKGQWRHIQDLKECKLISPELDEIRESLSKWLKKSAIKGWDDKTGKGFLRQIILRETKNTNERAVIFLTNDQYLDKYIDEITEYLPKTVTHIFSGLQSGSDELPLAGIFKTYKGGDFLQDKIKGIEYFIAPSSFFQTNHYAMEILLDTVLGYAKECKPKTILDLFCGSGFFTLPLSKVAKNILGVELDADAIHLAEKALLKNGISNVSFEAKDVMDFSLEEKWDLIVMDPPRSGVPLKIIKKIIDLNIPNIVYVSCDFESLAFNLKALLPYYDIEKVQPIDMFPHTPHIETVVLLKKK